MSDEAGNHPSPKNPSPHSPPHYESPRFRKTAAVENESWNGSPPDLSFSISEERNTTSMNLSFPTSSPRAGKNARTHRSRQKRLIGRWRGESMREPTLLTRDKRLSQKAGHPETQNKAAYCKCKSSLASGGAYRVLSIVSWSSLSPISILKLQRIQPLLVVLGDGI